MRLTVLEVTGNHNLAGVVCQKVQLELPAQSHSVWLWAAKACGGIAFARLLKENCLEVYIRPLKKGGERDVNEVIEAIERQFNAFNTPRHTADIVLHTTA